MNQLHLGHRLGAVGSATLQRYQNERLLYSLEHHQDVNFAFTKSAYKEPDRSGHAPEIRSKAHPTGVNCLAFDHNDARYLVSGGADASVRLWDLETTTGSPASPTFHPVAGLARNDKSSHTHAITSVSIYPFDPEPTTLLSTSFDKSLKLTSITPSSLQPIHSFPLDYAPYTHAISPLPTAASLIAVGTAHPAIRLLDLRSGLSTHSLQGHNGAIYSLAWSPTTAHLLVSGAHDGRVLFFDVRRANAAFASLDLDDAVGFDPSQQPLAESQPALNFSALAHNGPVTSVQFHPGNITPTTLVTAGHDQRIRLWDLATGRHELVHFGPRIRNSRSGTLSPLLTPPGHVSKASREVLLWPNDDARGDVMMHSLREGNLIRVMRMRGIDRVEMSKDKSKVARLTSQGRINQLAWRMGDCVPGGGLEMYSAHGDGSICVWKPEVEGEEDEVEQDHEVTKGKATGSRIGFNAAVEGDDEDRDKKRKRKAEMLGDLVQGLTKRLPT